MPIHWKVFQKFIFDEKKKQYLKNNDAKNRAMESNEKMKRINKNAQFKYQILFPMQLMVFKMLKIYKDIYQPIERWK